VKALHGSAEVEHGGIKIAACVWGWAGAEERKEGSRAAEYSPEREGEREREEGYKFEGGWVTRGVEH